MHEHSIYPLTQKKGCTIVAGHKYDAHTYMHFLLVSVSDLCTFYIQRGGEGCMHAW